MRLRTSLWLMLVLASASHAQDTAEQQVLTFYQNYLHHFEDENDQGYHASWLTKYVTKNTLERLNTIIEVPEQEILQADYFTYTQDYDPQWIAQLRVQAAKSVSSTLQQVDVFEGVENGQALHLQVDVRREDNQWKIDRVRDITHHDEMSLEGTKP